MVGRDEVTDEDDEDEDEDDRCELQVGGDKRRYRNRQAVRPAQPQQIDESL